MKLKIDASNYIGWKKIKVHFSTIFFQPTPIFLNREKLGKMVKVLGFKQI